MFPLYCEVDVVSLKRALSRHVSKLISTEPVVLNREVDNAVQILKPGKAMLEITMIENVKFKRQPKCDGDIIVEPFAIFDIDKSSCNYKVGKLLCAKCTVYNPLNKYEICDEEKYKRDMILAKKRCESEDWRDLYNTYVKNGASKEDAYLLITSLNN